MKRLRRPFNHVSTSALTLAAALCAALPSPAPAQVTALSASMTWESNTVGSANIQGIAYDSDGNLFACRSADGKVLTFRRNAGVLPNSFQIFPTSGSIPGARAVAIRPGTANRHVYVAGNSGIVVYDYDIVNNTATAITCTFPSLGTYPYNTSIEQLRFSPDGDWLYVTHSGALITFSSKFYGPVSTIRVLHRESDSSWSDSGVYIAPRNSTPASPDRDPRNNQGQSHGMALDGNGHLWVASDTDPMVWDGSTNSNANTYKAQYGKYARPMRYYQRVVDATGRPSFVLAAEVPVDNKIMGISVAANGVLYASEGISSSPTPPAGVHPSHRVYAYRGTKRIGFIDTKTGSFTLEDLQSLDIHSTDAGPTVQGRRGTGYYLQQWTVTNLPPETRWTVEGRVTDARTGQPIGNAVVRMFNVSTTTNPDGSYSLSVPDSGVADVQNPSVSLPPDPYYVVSADAPGYLRTTISPFRVHANTTLDIAMSTTTGEVSLALGAMDVQQGLRRTNAADGDTVLTDTALGIGYNQRTLGRAVSTDYVTGNNRLDTRIYFDLDDAYQGIGTPTLLSIRWLDEIAAQTYSWKLGFDSASGSPTGEDSLYIQRGIDDRPRSSAFYLPDAIFSNQLASGSDFYIQDGATNFLPLSVLHISMTPPGGLFRSNVAPPGWEGGLGRAAGSEFRDAPTVYNGIVYVATENGALSAINVDAPTYQSSFGTGGSVFIGSRLAGRPVVFMAPSDGLVHICTLGLGGVLKSVRSTDGAADWPDAYPVSTFPPEAGPVNATAAPVVSLDDSVSPAVPMIFAGINKGNEAYLIRVRWNDAQAIPLAVDLSGGTSEKAVIASAPAVGANGQQVMVGYMKGNDGHMLITDTALVPLRDISAPGEAIAVPATLTRDGRTMLLGTRTGTNGHVYAVNASNAQPLWNAEVGAVDSPLWIDYLRDPNTVHVVTRDNRLHALDVATGQEKPGWPVQPPAGQMGGVLFTAGDNIYVGSDIGLLVTPRTNPGNFVALTPLTINAATVACVLPGQDVGCSLTGRNPNSDVIFSTGSDGKLYAFYVQP